MMAMKISYEDLQIISSCLTSVKDDNFTKSLNHFLENKKDDYYFCGRQTVENTPNLEIKTEQLERIVSYVDKTQYKSIYDNVKSVYESARVSFQKIIFLYGRGK